MDKIFLVHLNAPNFPGLIDAYGIKTIAGHFNSKLYGAKAYIFNLDIIDKTELINSIINNFPIIIGFSLRQGTFDEFIQVYSDIKKILKNDVIVKNYNPKIVVGNIVPAISYKRILRKYPELYVCLKEGEEFLIDFYLFSTGLKSINKVKNLAYFDFHNNCLKKGDTTYIKKLDSLGLPSYATEITSKFQAEIQEIYKLGGLIAIESSRGCPWSKCSFCLIRHMLGNYKNKEKWRPFSVRNIEQKIDNLISNKIKKFLFLDEEFFGPGERGISHANDIARMIIKNRGRWGDVGFRLSGRVDSIINPKDTIKLANKRFETIRLLKKAGLKSIYLGVDGLSNEHLKELNKGYKIDTAARAIKILKRLNIGFEIGSITFTPYTSIKSLKCVIQFIEKNSIIKNISFFNNTVRIFHGSEYSKKILTEDQNLISKSYDINTLEYKIQRFKDNKVNYIYKTCIRDWLGTYGNFYYALRRASQGEAHEGKMIMAIENLRKLSAMLKELDILLLKALINENNNININSTYNIRKLNRKEKVDYIFDFVKKDSALYDPSGLIQKSYENFCLLN